MNLKVLLLSILLLIEPVSNEQIQKNMGFKQSEAIGYNINYQQSQALKSPGYHSVTVVANDGTSFTVTYWVGAGLLIDYNIAHVLNDGGLDLQNTYRSEASLLAAIQVALVEYNSKTFPVGSPFCLFLLGGAYALHKMRKKHEQDNDLSE